MEAPAQRFAPRVWSGGIPAGVEYGDRELESGPLGGRGIRPGLAPDLAADAVTDVPGNGIAEVLGTSVSIEDNTPPTLSSAGTYAIDGTGTGIALQFNETVVSTSIPATSAFAAKIAGTAVGVTSVTRDTTDADAAFGMHWAKKA